jgi:hypothetical protein
MSRNAEWLQAERLRTVTGDDCPACGGRDVRGHERSEVCTGALFWSCTDCGFPWPRFASPVSRWLVQTSIDAAEEHEPRTRRSDRCRSGRTAGSVALYRQIW